MIYTLKQLYLENLELEANNEVQQSIIEYLKNSENSFVNDKHNKFFKALQEKSQLELVNSVKTKEKINNVKDRKDLASVLFDANALEVNDETINEIRKTREVKITSYGEGIKEPFKEILFTSNVMLTLPRDKEAIKDEYKAKIDFDEPQKYWFDHPIPLDIDNKSNEILYGLSHFNESLKVELAKGEKARIAISVSCTHESLKNIAKDYMLEKLKEIELECLEVYIFTENETMQLLELCYKEKVDNLSYQKLQETIGVDGKYGRHYSFLKGISAFFSRYIDSNIKATFKIDLDQVFDQEKMMEYTGSYTLDKFKNILWGAEGVDAKDRKVKLGMMAGYLINDADIDKSMYEPDVNFPTEELNAEQYAFNSGRPQYISSKAEMLNPDTSIERAGMRYHITGGMNGILIEDLKEYKPFTPSFITRAEDQCFMLEIVNKPIKDTFLRCYHQHGLFMRHDKATFLHEDLKQFEVPKKVGDYERILLFTHYAKDILNDYELIKQEIQPFTSSFIVEVPYTTVLFRALFAAYELSKKNVDDAKEFLDLICERVANVIENIENETYHKTYNKEKESWKIYYDGMDSTVIAKEDLEQFIEAIKY